MSLTASPSSATLATPTIGRRTPPTMSPASGGSRRRSGRIEEPSLAATFTAFPPHSTRPPFARALATCASSFSGAPGCAIGPSVGGRVHRVAHPQLAHLGEPPSTNLSYRLRCTLNPLDAAAALAGVVERAVDQVRDACSRSRPEPRRRVLASQLQAGVDEIACWPPKTSCPPRTEPGEAEYPISGRPMMRAQASCPRGRRDQPLRPPSAGEKRARTPRRTRRSASRA